MAKARVELVKGLSLDVRGRHFEPGKPLVTDNIADIRYFETHPALSVTRLKETGEKAKPAAKTPAKAAPTKSKSAPPPKRDEDEDEDDELDEDESDDEGSEDEGGDEVTEESLSAMTKNDLITLASGAPYNLELKPELSKSKMIEAILAAKPA